MIRIRSQLVYLSLLTVLTLIACSFLSGLGQQVNEVKSTANSVETLAQQGDKFMGTAQSMATELSQSGLYKTAQVIITQQGPGILETAQAYATNEGPSMLQTIQAAVTQMGENNGQVPSDIPVLKEGMSDLYASANIVKYNTPTELSKAIDFYKSNMPAQGWTKNDTGTLISDYTAVLNYTKGTRSASVSLSVNPATKQTLIIITIEGK